MRKSLILFICGIINIFLGSLMFIPAAVDCFTDQEKNSDTFLLCALFTLFLGTVTAALSYRRWTEKLSTKEMFVITSSIWFLAGFIAALPFYFSGFNLSITDSVFESISGLTTTGATVLENIDTMPKGFLLWRSMLQWIGGIGIIILAIAILPILRIGGMQLFTTESSDSSSKDSPFVASKLKRYIYAYLFISCLCVWSLFASGMDFFDAIAHMMTTVSSGGFSTHDKSIAFYQSPLIEWILILFMIIGGLPFAIIVEFLEGKWKKIKTNTQIQSYLGSLIVIILPISILMLAFIEQFDLFFNALRIFAFHVVSVVTTTGFVTENYTLWGPFFVLLFFLLTSVGGCTGSTTGGIKTFRFSILSKAIKRHLTLMVSPHAIVVPHYNSKPITDDIMLSVTSFVSIFFLVTILAAFGLTLTGLDFITALSGSLTAVANVGPGLGDIIGPDKTFARLPDVAKWILALVMILGRLEFMTIIVLFLPKLWRKN
jgi:trk system potassium uptake protein TrkH